MASLPQCATAAAAASSIRRPVRKRSSVNGASIGCGSSRRDGVREDVARARRRLEAAGAPAAVDVEARHRRLADDRRAVRRDVDDAAPVAQHPQAAGTSGTARRSHRACALMMCSPPVWRIGGVLVGAGADDELALVGLRDVGVNRVRHHDAGKDRLHRLGDQRLQRKAFQRHADAGHLHDDAGVAGRDDADLLRADEAARRLDAVDRAVGVAADARDLAILDDVDAARIGARGHSPRRPRRAARCRRAAAGRRRGPG